jgi:zinc protease
MPIPASDLLSIPFTEGRLDNGLRVLVHEQRGEPVVAVHVMVHVGSRHEPPGRTGFAHLFEHLLFQGSQHVPSGEHFRLVQDAGGTLNGSTWFDRTNFFEILPSNALELALWLESDRLGWFLPALDLAKFETQRAVVQNERRQRYENQPYGLWLETMLALLFPPDHPYAHPTIGAMVDIDAASLDDARAFFETFYCPPNITLVVAGDVEESRARALVDRWFGPIPSRVPPPAPTAPPVTLEAERRAVIPARVEVPRIYLGYHAPRWKDPDSMALAAAAAVLAGHRGARLSRELVHRRLLAQECAATKMQEIEASGLFLAVLTGKPGAPVDELIRAYDDVVDELAAKGPSAEETVAARRLLRLGLARRLEDVGGRADALAHAAVLLDDPGFVETQQAWIEEVDEAAIRVAVQRWLGRGRAVVAYEPKPHD